MLPPRTWLTNHADSGLADVRSDHAALLGAADRPIRKVEKETRPDCNSKSQSVHFFKSRGARSCRLHSFFDPIPTSYPDLNQSYPRIVQRVFNFSATRQEPSTFSPVFCSVADFALFRATWQLLHWLPNTSLQKHRIRLDSHPYLSFKSSRQDARSGGALLCGRVCSVSCRPCG